MKIYRIASAPQGNVKLNGTKLTVYHRTKSGDLGGSICNIGFLAGSGAAYGKGIYSTYTIESTLRNNMLHGYGSEVVKGSMDIKGFLIFDYPIAKMIYGNDYKLIDQIRIIGEDKIFGLASNKEETRKRFEKYSEELETMPHSSHIAKP